MKALLAAIFLLLPAAAVQAGYFDTPTGGLGIKDRAEAPKPDRPAPKDKAAD